MFVPEGTVIDDEVFKLAEKRVCWWCQKYRKLNIKNVHKIYVKPIQRSEKQYLYFLRMVDTHSSSVPGHSVYSKPAWK
jgi:hypothetical protein